MNSLWKDLLFLHGHLVRKEDLDWRPEAPTEPTRNSTNVGKTKRSLLACCAHVWPRIMSPR